MLPGYFETLRTKLIEGRSFTDADNVPGPRLVVIDSDLAAIAFPNQSAIGKRLLIRARTPEPEWFEVIGVVAHQRRASLARPGREALFLTDAYFGQGVEHRFPAVALSNAREDAINAHGGSGGQRRLRCRRRAGDGFGREPRHLVGTPAHSRAAVPRSFNYSA